MLQNQPDQHKLRNITPILLENDESNIIVYDNKTVANNNPSIPNMDKYKNNNLDELIIYGKRKKLDNQRYVDMNCKVSIPIIKKTSNDDEIFIYGKRKIVQKTTTTITTTTSCSTNNINTNNNCFNNYPSNSNVVNLMLE